MMRAGERSLTAGDYLDLARQADAQASATKDPEAAAALKRMAEDYSAKGKELGEAKDGDKPESRDRRK